MDRAQQLDALFDIMVACHMDVPLREQWIAHYMGENCELWPLMKGDKLVGGILFTGHVLHIAVHPDWQGRWVTKDMLRGYRAWYHEVTLYAYPHKNNAQAIELLKRLGWKQSQAETINPDHIVYIKEPA
jgi:ribosomal protein S18 acetylase RimI-like enzyme